MTTIEFVTKNLNKAKINLEKALKKPNATPEEIATLEEQVGHYEHILYVFEVMANQECDCDADR